MRQQLKRPAGGLPQLSSKRQNVVGTPKPLYGQTPQRNEGEAIINKEWEDDSQADFLTGLSLLSQLSALPKPQNEIEITQKEIEDREKTLKVKKMTEKEKAEANRLRDAEDRQKQAELILAIQKEEEKKTQTEVMKRGLPRPT